MTWDGFFDTAPGGADATRIELFNGTGALVQTLLPSPDLLAGSGSTLTTSVTVADAGWWGVRLTAPASFTGTSAGHYLMDVTVHDVTDHLDLTKSNRHYLLPGSIKAPPLPEPASLVLLAAGLAGLGAGVRRRG